MKINDACKDILTQLGYVVKNINDENFNQPIPLLSNSTIGQHIRHTLEFFTCLMDNVDNGEINYDQREHDKFIESDRAIASQVIENITDFLDTISSDQPLTLKANYSLNNDDLLEVKTNLYRELAYNIEHAIHHMAIIKIGVKELDTDLTLPPHFGVALSTIKYQELTEQ